MFACDDDRHAEICGLYLFKHRFEAGSVLIGSTDVGLVSHMIQNLRIGMPGKATAQIVVGQIVRGGGCDQFVNLL